MPRLYAVPVGRLGHGAGLKLTGTNPGQFTLGATTCTTAVAPAGTCTVAVRFAPTSAGDKTAELTFTGNAPGSPHTVALTGTCTCTPVQIPPTSPPPTGPTPLPARPTPQTLKAALPKRIKRSGLTVITAANARTNAGQRVRTTVRRIPTKPAAAPATRYFKIVRGPKGKTSIRTYGYPNLKLRITQKAPATTGYTPFTRTATYTRGRLG